MRAYISNLLLQGNDVIIRVLTYYCISLQDKSGRGLISCMETFFKPLDSMQRADSLAKKHFFITSSLWGFYDF